jgi:hypothetical protein
LNLRAEGATWKSTARGACAAGTPVSGAGRSVEPAVAAKGHRVRTIGNHWQKLFLKVVTNPAFEVIAAIIVVLLATWIVVQTESETRITAFPLLFGHK